MPLLQADHDYLQGVLSPGELIHESVPDFRSHSVPWSLSYDRQPSLAIAPSSLAQVQNIVKYLYDHKTIDFAIRGRGTGSTSAQDVILSMRNFNDITFDEAKQEVEIGAGCDWGEVDSRLAALVSESIGYDTFTSANNTDV